MTGCQAPEGPIFCINNCSFYGSVATMNMCSKCHKDIILNQQQAQLAASSIESIVNGNFSRNGKELVVVGAVDVHAAPVERRRWINSTGKERVWMSSDFRWRWINSELIFERYFFDKSQWKAGETQEKLLFLKRWFLHFIIWDPHQFFSLFGLTKHQIIQLFSNDGSNLTTRALRFMGLCYITGKNNI